MSAGLPSLATLLAWRQVTHSLWVTVESTQACVLYSRTREKFTLCTRGRRQEDKLDSKADYPRVYILYIQSGSSTELSLSVWVSMTMHVWVMRWLMHWRVVVINSLSYCADWCTLLRTRQRCSVARLERLPQHWIESELLPVWCRRRWQPLDKVLVQELGNAQQWTANS